MSSRAVEFAYLRLMGLGNIVDGFVMVFTPWRPKLALRAATRLARYRGRRRLAAAGLVDQRSGDGA